MISSFVGSEGHKTPGGDTDLARGAREPRRTATFAGVGRAPRALAAGTGLATDGDGGAAATFGTGKGEKKKARRSREA